jgi:drug/metabolite transporter (DMT)-like permease
MAISVSKLGFNSSLALVLMAPMIFIAFVPIITKESVNAAQVIGILLTAAGAFCILYSLGLIHPGSWAEVGYVIGAAVCWAAFSLLALRTKTGIFANVYLYLLMGLIISTVLMFVQSSFILPTYGTVGLLLIFGILLATALYLWAGTFRIASASFWTSMTFILPAVLLIYGFLFNSVSIPFLGIIGLGITGVAVLYRLIIKM